MLIKTLMIIAEKLFILIKILMISTEASLKLAETFVVFQLKFDFSG